MKQKFIGGYIVAFILTLILGSCVGRSDIVESCADNNTFRHNGIEYTCERNDE